MIKVYGPRASSAGRVYWLCEEMGIPYESIAVDMRNGEHKSPEFLALNPNGKVPVMVEDNFILWESMAINLYLAEKFGGALLGAMPEEKAKIMQWTFWVASNVAHPLELVVVAKWRQQAEGPEHALARTQVLGLLPILEGALAGKEYLVGSEFSLADINVASVLAGAAFISLDMSAFTNITTWLARCSERAAYKKARG